jgi:DNA-binding transcriptional regulator YiaG
MSDETPIEALYGQIWAEPKTQDVDPGKHRAGMASRAERLTEQQAPLRQMYAAGASLQQVADHFGVPKSKVRSALRRVGQPTRRHRNARQPKMSPAEGRKVLQTAQADLTPDLLAPVLRALLGSRSLADLCFTVIGDLKDRRFPTIRVDDPRKVLAWLAGEYQPAYTAWATLLAPLGCSFVAFDGRGTVVSFAGTDDLTLPAWDDPSGDLDGIEESDEYLRIEEEHGRPAADAWVDAQSDAIPAAPPPTVDFMHRVRSRLGVRFSELATLSGIPENTLRRYERGETDPTYERLYRLAQVAGMHLRLVPHDSEDDGPSSAIADSDRLVLSYDEWQQHFGG